MADDEKETRDRVEDDADGQGFKMHVADTEDDAAGDDAEGNILSRSQSHADLKDEDDMKGHGKRKL